MADTYVYIIHEPDWDSDEFLGRPRDRLRGVLLGVVEAAGVRRQGTHDVRPGVAERVLELTGGRPHGPILTRGPAASPSTRHSPNG